LVIHFSFTLYNILTDSIKNPITIGWFYTHFDIFHQRVLWCVYIT
jgi:hypothetical protein